MILHILLVDCHIFKDPLRFTIFIERGQSICQRCLHDYLAWASAVARNWAIKCVHLLDACEKLVFESFCQLGQLDVVVAFFCTWVIHLIRPSLPAITSRTTPTSLSLTSPLLSILRSSAGLFLLLFVVRLLVILCRGDCVWALWVVHLIGSIL